MTVTGSRTQGTGPANSGSPRRELLATRGPSLKGGGRQHSFSMWMSSSPRRAAWSFVEKLEATGRSGSSCLRGARLAQPPPGSALGPRSCRGLAACGPNSTWKLNYVATAHARVGGAGGRGASWLYACQNVLRGTAPEVGLHLLLLLYLLFSSMENNRLG